MDSGTIVKSEREPSQYSAFKFVTENKFKDLTEKFVRFDAY